MKIEVNEKTTAAESARKWQQENRAAIEAYNRMIEADGFLFSEGARAF